MCTHCFLQTMLLYNDCTIASPSIAVSMASRYLVVANHFYIHQISLDGTRMRVALSGLEQAVSVDYHFRRNRLYWVDQGRRAIMETNLDGFKRSVLLDQGLTRPSNITFKLRTTTCSHDSYMHMYFHCRRSVSGLD